MPATVNPSALEGEGELGPPETLGPPMSVRPTEDYFELGNACHAFLAGDRLEDAPDARIAHAHAQVEAFGVGEHVIPEQLVQASTAFRTWVERRWPGATWRTEWPLAMVQPDGSVLRGYADLVLETPDGLVLLDHKCHGGSLEHVLVVARVHGAQLDAYRTVLTTATGRPVLARWIHLPFQGVCVEMLG